MWDKNGNGWCRVYSEGGMTGWIEWAGDEDKEELAKADGFEDGEYAPNELEREKMEKEKTAAEKMFEFLDKHYDLSELKVFQVIRFKRLG